jgi:hypothetical protein
MAALNPEHLLEQADRLIAPPGGGAPRQADLKRAMSTAYYAVFHAILTAAADDFVGVTHRSTPRYALLYRSIGHGSLRAFCEDVIKRTIPSKYSGYAPTGGFGTDLTALATALVDLQEKRHLADYDPLFRVNTSDAVLAVATARSAVARFNNASRASRRAFLSLVVFTPRWSP